MTVLFLEFIIPYVFLSSESVFNYYSERFSVWPILEVHRPLSPSLLLRVVLFRVFGGPVDPLGGVPFAVECPMAGLWDLAWLAPLRLWSTSW